MWLSQDPDPLHASRFRAASETIGRPQLETGSRSFGSRTRQRSLRSPRGDGCDEPDAGEAERESAVVTLIDCHGNFP
jgi:hypothetical protein